MASWNTNARCTLKNWSKWQERRATYPRLNGWRRMTEFWPNTPWRRSLDNRCLNGFATTRILKFGRIWRHRFAGFKSQMNWKTRKYWLCSWDWTTFPLFRGLRARGERWNRCAWRWETESKWFWSSERSLMGLENKKDFCRLLIRRRPCSRSWWRGDGDLIQIYSTD